MKTFTQKQKVATLFAGLLAIGALAGVIAIFGTGESSGQAGSSSPAGPSVTVPAAKTPTNTTTSSTAHASTNTSMTSNAEPVAGNGETGSAGGGAAPGSGGQASSQAGSPTPPAPSSGPYDTEAAAIAFVQSQDNGFGHKMGVIDPDHTWRSGSTLHAIHATPTGTGSYGGDYYYFFVNGYLVGSESFDLASPNPAGMSDTTFAVKFEVYKHLDPHCCPSGGQSTVLFDWDGTQLKTIGSMTGAHMS